MHKMCKKRGVIVLLINIAFNLFDLNKKLNVVRTCFLVMLGCLLFFPFFSFVFYEMN